VLVNVISTAKPENSINNQEESIQKMIFKHIAMCILGDNKILIVSPYAYGLFGSDSAQKLKDLYRAAMENPLFKGKIHKIMIANKWMEDSGVVRSYKGNLI
jgi:hypothetical protein